jgi:23S rRNA (uridine2552-2'-O)-methyltransferase
MKYTEDYYARLAREKGYPARSVFKLMEMQEKYRIIRKGDMVLDVGASPGSFSLYILEKLEGTGIVTAVDLNDVSFKKIKPPSNKFRFIRGNIFDEKIVEELANFGPYGLVISDAAPSTTGDRTVDTSRSLDLARQVLIIAGKCLRQGGRCVIKIFQGGDEKEISDAMKLLFDSVKIFKPKASKKASIEIYFLGFDFKRKQ